MRKFIKMSMVIVAVGVLGTVATSVMAAQVQNAAMLEGAQSVRAPIALIEDVLSRNKPRVPGGSGCDDPQDQVEHPECRSASIAKPEDLLARSKPRVPGGSGCDDPQDLAEHPECRP
jgi:hypothetical protein